MEKGEVTNYYGVMWLTTRFGTSNKNGLPNVTHYNANHKVRFLSTKWQLTIWNDNYTPSRCCLSLSLSAPIPFIHFPEKGKAVGRMKTTCWKWNKKRLEWTWTQDLCLFGAIVSKVLIRAVKLDYQFSIAQNDCRSSAALCPLYQSSFD